MSIVIASADGFIISDRRVSADGERCRPRDKVFGNDDLLVGVVGTYASVMAVRKVMGPKGARNPDDLVDVIDEDSMALCVYKGQLWEIGDLGAEMIPEKYHAVGSGADGALGFLAGKGKCTPDTAKDAIKFACTLRTDCGDGVKLILPKR